jgi:uncharacterized membrane protein YfcA
MMSLFNTSSNVLHYGILGAIPYPWCFVVFSVGLCGGYAGRYIALYITKTYGRASITVFMLVSVLLASICLLVYHIIADERDFAMHAFC